jgi:aminopeptidase N
MKQFLLLLLLCAAQLVRAQEAPKAYTADDTLRGSITPQRSWWDLSYYQLDVRVNIEKTAISGSNIVYYKVLRANQVMQIDLQAPMKMEQVLQDGKTQEFKRVGRNVYLITLQKPQIPGKRESITVQYAGVPRKARNAPWDGGFSWDEDKAGKPFVATSCQGLGASVWWPCKDHMYDEPDNGVVISVNVPSNLVAVSNGRLKKEQKKWK